MNLLKKDAVLVYFDYKAKYINIFVISLSSPIFNVLTSENFDK